MTLDWLFSGRRIELVFFWGGGHNSRGMRLQWILLCRKVIVGNKRICITVHFWVVVLGLWSLCVQYQPPRVLGRTCEPVRDARAQGSDGKTVERNWSLPWCD